MLTFTYVYRHARVYIFKMSRCYIVSISAYLPLSGFYLGSVKQFVLRVISSREAITFFTKRHKIQF